MPASAVITPPLLHHALGHDPATSCARPAEQGAWGDVKPMPGRVNVPSFSRLYRLRNLVERFFNKLKHFRAAAARFEKRDGNDLALVKLAASRIWMRFIHRQTNENSPVNCSLRQQRPNELFAAGIND
jgi:hypothetical protein